MMHSRLRHGLWFAAMMLPKIRSRLEFEAPLEAIAGAVLLQVTRYEALFDPQSFSSCIVPQGVCLEPRL